jgi:hypothetical protein
MESRYFCVSNSRSGVRKAVWSTLKDGEVPLEKMDKSGNAWFKLSILLLRNYTQWTKSGLFLAAVELLIKKKY